MDLWPEDNLLCSWSISAVDVEIQLRGEQLICKEIRKGIVYTVVSQESRIFH